MQPWILDSSPGVSEVLGFGSGSDHCGSFLWFGYLFSFFFFFFFGGLNCQLQRTPKFNQIFDSVCPIFYYRHYLPKISKLLTF